MFKIFFMLISLSYFNTCLADDHHLPDNTIIESPNIIKGRLLASNCFQCHGTQGSGGFEILLNHSQLGIFIEMMAQKVNIKRNIMGVHAQGYTKEQLWDLSGYLAKINTTTQR